MHIVTLTIYGDLNENGRYRLIYLIVWLPVYDCKSCSIVGIVSLKKDTMN